MTDEGGLTQGAGRLNNQSQIGREGRGASIRRDSGCWLQKWGWQRKGTPRKKRFYIKFDARKKRNASSVGEHRKDITEGHMKIEEQSPTRVNKKKLGTRRRAWGRKMREVGIVNEDIWLSTSLGGKKKASHLETRGKKTSAHPTGRERISLYIERKEDLLARKRTEKVNRKLRAGGKRPTFLGRN